MARTEYLNMCRPIPLPHPGSILDSTGNPKANESSKAEIFLDQVITQLVDLLLQNQKKYLQKVVEANLDKEDYSNLED